MIFNLFNKKSSDKRSDEFGKRYNDWFSYIVEKELSRIRYGHQNHSSLQFVKIICKAGIFNNCGVEIPT